MFSIGSSSLTHSHPHVSIHIHANEPSWQPCTRSRGFRMPMESNTLEKHNDWWLWPHLTNLRSWEWNRFHRFYIGSIGKTKSPVLAMEVLGAHVWRGYPQRNAEGVCFHSQSYREKPKPRIPKWQPRLDRVWWLWTCLGIPTLHRGVMQQKIFCPFKSLKTHNGTLTKMLYHYIGSIVG